MASTLELNALARSLWGPLKPYFLAYGSAYVESTYTPTYTGGTAAGTTTYSTQVGFYTRIGRVVVFNGIVVWTAATGTGDVHVSLPFTATNTTNMRYSGAVRTDSITFANGSVQMLINPNTDYFLMYSPATNAAPTALAVEAAGNLVFSGFFYTS